MPNTDKTKKARTDKDSDLTNLKPILVVLFGFVFVCIGIVMFAVRYDAENLSFKPETPRQAYLRIIGEPHTGLRLARLHDFTENYALNDDTIRARTARDVLSGHEQRDWANLTQTLYSLRSTDQQNTKALTAYKSVWGVWNRQADLPALLQATGVVIISSSDMHYAPNSRRSKFAAGKEGNKLAGDIQNTDPQLNTIDSRDSLEIASNYDVQKARMRLAKRPKYPGKARRKGIEAVVVLSLFIDERGNVARTETVSVDAAKYRNSFVRASKRAAMASKFHPKTIGGKPVATSNYLRQYAFTKEE